MAILTDFRNAVAAKVEEATGITVKAGKFDGPVRNAKLGCCFPVAVRERVPVSTESLEVRVRLFLNFNEKAPDAEIPLDPAPLEELIEECQAILSPDGIGETPNVGIWFARMTEAEVNMDQYGIEFAVVAVAWNQFAVV